MDKQEYQKILVLDIKSRGYKWDTVRSKGGEEIPLEQAGIPQLKAIQYKLKKQNETSLLRKVSETLKSHEAARI